MKLIKNERNLGIAQVLLSGVCFGFLGLFGKTAFARGLTPGEFLSLRFLLGGIILLGFLIVSRPKSLAVPSRQIGVCALLGIFGYALFSSCFFQALNGLSASLTVLLLYTYPVIVTLAAWAFFGEAVPRSKWLALPMVMAGLALLIWGDFQVLDSTALIFGFASALFYAAYILASSRWLQNMDSLVAVTYIQLAAGLVLGTLYWRDFSRFLNVLQAQLPLLSATALIGSVAAMSLFLAGLKRLKSWEVSLLSTAEPVTGVLIAVSFLHERLTVQQVFGAAAILAAFIMISRKSNDHTDLVDFP